MNGSCRSVVLLKSTGLLWQLYLSRVGCHFHFMVFFVAPTLLHMFSPALLAPFASMRSASQLTSPPLQPLNPNPTNLDVVLLFCCASGFVGSPWTLATYIIEGASSSLYKTIKSMAYSNPELLHALLSQLADAMSDYIKYQIDSGAQCVQIFDSWGGQLPPQQWDR